MKKIRESRNNGYTNKIRVLRELTLEGIGSWYFGGIDRDLQPRKEIILSYTVRSLIDTRDSKLIAKKAIFPESVAKEADMEKFLKIKEFGFIENPDLVDREEWEDVDPETLYRVNLNRTDGIAFYYNYYKGFETYCDKHVPKEYWEEEKAYVLEYKGKRQPISISPEKYRETVEENGDIYIWV